MPNAIPAAGEAMPKIAQADSRNAVEDGLLDLEADICDLYSMALITDYMLDQLIIGRHANDKSPINSYELDMLVFAWKNVTSRAHILKRSFYAAAHGEDA